jgi:hypothetical protein
MLVLLVGLGAFQHARSHGAVGAHSGSVGTELTAETVDHEALAADGPRWFSAEGVDEVVTRDDALRVPPRRL